MNFYVMMTVIGLIILLIGIVIAVATKDSCEDYLEFIVTPIIFIGFSLLVGCGIVSIVQPINLKQEQLRMTKEREQIEYQIENLTEQSDKIKLNEWILTYNDWVNDVNTDKETYGWVSWYNDFDMTNHKIIQLV